LSGFYVFAKRKERKKLVRSVINSIVQLELNLISRAAAAAKCISHTKKRMTKRNKHNTGMKHERAKIIGTLKEKKHMIPLTPGVTVQLYMGEPRKNASSLSETHIESEGIEPKN
jgi:hypothetical protein